MTPGAASRRRIATLADETHLPKVSGRADRKPSVAGVWRIPLPWPAPLLRDNDRMHWAQKHRITAQLRQTATLLARSQQLPKGLERARIGLCWQPKVARRRDPLSIAPTLKPLVDGLVDYGLVADDDTAHVELVCDVFDARPGVAAALWLSVRELRDGPGTAA